MKEVPHGAVPLNELHDQYLIYCHEEHVVPGTKDFASKVIERVLPAVKKKYVSAQNAVTKKWSSKTVVYDHLSLSTEQKTTCSQAILFPEYCSPLVTGSADELVYSLSVPTTHTVNGQTIVVDVTIQNSLIDMKLGLIAIDLEAIHYRKCIKLLDQSHVDSILKLIQELRLCKGWAAQEEDPSVACGVMEQWGKIGLAATENRVRSKTCKGVISFSANSTTCLPCQKARDYLHVMKKSSSAVHSKLQASENS